MRFPNGRIMVFCKAPEPGAVKTRLAKSIGEREAATIHEFLAWHCLKNIVAARIAPVELWCSPNVEHDFFQQLAENFSVPLKRQDGDSLGERMEHAFSSTLSYSEYSVVIGTDCPAINSNYLIAAFSTLKGGGSVIGPAEDGGYTLLGLSKLQSKIFSDISWGTSTVLEETMLSIQGAVNKLPTLWDVDYVKDLKRLSAVANELSLEEAFVEYLDKLEWND